MPSFQLLVLLLTWHSTSGEIVRGEAGSVLYQQNANDTDKFIVSKSFDKNVSTLYHSGHGLTHQWIRLYLDRPRKVKQIEIVNRWVKSESLSQFSGVQSIPVFRNFPTLLARLPVLSDPWAYHNPDHSTRRLLGTTITLLGAETSQLCGEVTEINPNLYLVTDQTYRFVCNFTGAKTSQIKLEDRVEDYRDAECCGVVMTIAEVRVFDVGK